MMRDKAAAVVKKIMKMVAETAKAKTMELKRKSRAFKTRLIIFSLLHNRKTLMGSISHKIKGLMGQAHPHPKKIKREEEERRDAVVYYDNNQIMNGNTEYEIEDEDEVEDEEEEEDDDKYPDLRHSLFEEGEGSVIEMVKHSKEDKGEEFRLEDEIDTVADLYIERFHRHMWLQKQLSFDHSSP